MSGRPAPPALLLLGGIDPSGGAGLAADLGAARRLGVHPLPVPTCLTVQSRLAFRRAQAVEPELLRAMVEAAREHLAPAAAKVGLLAGPGQAALAAAVLPREVPLVLDPVLRPTLAQEGVAGLAAALVAELLPRGPVVTPNGPELAALAGVAGAEEGAARLLAQGARAVVLKGGHGGVGPQLTNTLFTERGGRRDFTLARWGAGEVHGTGCAFAAALAALLAKGSELDEAVREAGEFTAGLVERSWRAGEGPANLGF